MLLSIFAAGALAYLPFAVALISVFFFWKARKDSRYYQFAIPLIIVAVIIFLVINSDYHGLK